MWSVDSVVTYRCCSMRHLLASIDRAYSKVKTEWVFHCEDDWEFFSGGFIEQSFTLLEEFDKFSLIELRSPGRSSPQSG